MKPSNLRTLLALAVIAAAIGNTGCAKKAVETPPATPPAPPVQTTPTPTPKPVEQPAAPAPSASKVSEQDFQPAYFDFDAYALRDDAKAALDKDGKLLRDNAKLNVTLEGHCDERGTVEYNQALGEKRAQAARDYLVAAGIDTGRLQIVSYGKERPFDSGHDESAWAKNRRAHFTLR